MMQIQYGNVNVVSRTALTTSANANAITSNAQVVFGNASMRTTAQGDFVRINAAPSLNFGSNSFTLEFRYQSVANTTSFPSMINNFNISDFGFVLDSWTVQERRSGTNTLTFWVVNFNNAVPLLTSNVAVGGNTWYSVAIQRHANNVFQMYLNGNLASSASFTGSLDSNQNRSIFCSQNANNTFYNGYLDEIRISNTARYTTNYTPATQPFTNDTNTVLLLHCDGANGANSFPDDNMISAQVGGLIIDTGSANNGITIQYEFPPFPAWPTMPTYDNVIFETSQWASNGTATATLGNLGVNPARTAAYGATVYHPDGNIYCIPEDANNVAIINPVTNTASTSTFGLTIPAGGSKFRGAALGADGKIYCIPLASANIMVLDPATNTGFFANYGLNLTAAGKWWGAVRSGDKIYGIPFDSPDILVIDTSANTAFRSNLGLSMTGTVKWAGGGLGKDNKIYCAPVNANDILIIDTSANTAARSNLGATLSAPTNFGMVLGGDGRLYSMPGGSNKQFLIIDPVANTAITTTYGLTLSDGDKCWTAVLGADDKIYSIPFTATDMMIIDVSANTAVRSNLGTSLTGSAKFSSGILGPSGNIYCSPFNANTFFRIQTNGTGNSFSSYNDVILSPYLNKY